MTTTVEALAADMRRALRVCTLHPGGPVMTYGRVLAALDEGRITEEQFQEVGAAVLAHSTARLGGDDDSRERLLARYVEALF